LSDDGQDNVESFFGRAAIGRLVLSSAIKGLRPADNIFFNEGEIAGS
jgi:hypothetical protein